MSKQESQVSAPKSDEVPKLVQYIVGIALGLILVGIGIPIVVTNKDLTVVATLVLSLVVSLGAGCLAHGVGGTIHFARHQKVVQGESSNETDYGATLGYVVAAVAFAVMSLVMFGDKLAPFILGGKS